MKLRELLRRINLVQRSFAFKVIATCVIVALALAFYVTYAVYVTAPTDQIAQDAAAAPVRGAPSPADPFESTQKAIEDILAASADPTAVGVGTALVAGLAVAVTWFGLALTYLALGLVLAGVAAPLILMDGTRGIGLLVAGAASLTAAFLILLELARLVFSGSGPVRAVARNVLAEAVRMKVSLVFIVILIVGLAGLPGVLDESQPLRYRVQTFISFGTGLSFWVIAILTLLFSAATVTFEQRDRIIWQTMTKPVAAWQYVLGKWLGVIALNGVLLVVCASGVFLFVDYLRSTPAVGEREAYVAAAFDEQITEDRLILETQVLAARVSFDIDPPLKKTDPEFLRAADEYIRAQRVGDPDFARTPAEIRQVKDELYTSWERAYRAVEPAGFERYIFRGLLGARQSNRPLTFRHRVDAGSNAPDEIMFVTFVFGVEDELAVVRRMSPGHYHTTTIPASVISPDGAVRLVVFNGDLQVGQPNPYPYTISFPRGGLELSYSAGSYRLNFARGMIILWVKLAFLAMLTIFVSTSVSFPVACLVAFGAFLGAEGSVYLGGALEHFRTEDLEGNVRPLHVVAEWVTRGVAWVFSGYGNLRPGNNLVEGLLISWSEVARGIGVMAVWVSAVYGLAVLAFRRRELATYSGH